MTEGGRQSLNKKQQGIGYQETEQDNSGKNAFDLRLYDSKLGQWLTPDPMMQHASPYLAMSNNPESFMDPTGGEDWSAHQDNYHFMRAMRRYERYGYDSFFDQGWDDGWGFGTDASGKKRQEADVFQVLFQRKMISEGYQKSDGFYFIEKKRTELKADVVYQGNLSRTQYSVEHESWKEYVVDPYYKEQSDAQNGGGCSNCLDPSTVKQQFWGIGGLTYPGGDNPLTRSGDYSFSYVPKNLAEYPAIGHDRRYDKLGIKGSSGLFTDTRAIGADWRFVTEELSIAANPYLDPVDRVTAGVLGVGLGMFALPKTVLQLSSPFGYGQIMIWYNISNQGVNNAPNIHKH